ncbi:MAG: hypothetical protein WA628_18685, partial [Terriglobales bacterium]
AQTPMPAAATASPKKAEAVAPPRPAPAAAQTPRKVERPRRRGSSSEEGIVAEDTVVFYDHRPVPSSTRTPPPTGVKRHSDEN